MIIHCQREAEWGLNCGEVEQQSMRNKHLNIGVMEYACLWERNNLSKQVE